MRLLVLTADYVPRPWSGIGTAVAVQAAALARQGVDVDVVVSEDRVSAQASASGGASVHALTPTRFPVRLEGVDVVHLHSLGLGELALRIRDRFGIPLVYTAHSSVHAELSDHNCRSAWGDVQAAMIAAADHVVFPSSCERELAVRRSGALRRRSSVHPNGVERSRAASRPETRTGPVVFAGRFAATKGLELLEAIVDLLRDRPEIRFALAGGHGDAEGLRRVTALAARHPGRCRVVGWLSPPALDRLFRSAALVVVPSRYEPFGLVALEAMRAGAPVLAAATGGLREVVRPGSGGELVVSRRPEEWRQAIVALWESPARRATLSRRGPRYVAARFDPDVLARSLIAKVYRPLSRRPAVVALGAAS